MGGHKVRHQQMETAGRKVGIGDRHFDHTAQTLLVSAFLASLYFIMLRVYFQSWLLARGQLLKLLLRFCMLGRLVAGFCPDVLCSQGLFMLIPALLVPMDIQQLRSRTTERKNHVHGSPRSSMF